MIFLWPWRVFKCQFTTQTFKWNLFHSLPISFSLSCLILAYELVGLLIVVQGVLL